MKKRKVDFPIKPLILCLIILLALFLVLGYIWRNLTTADYFRVKDIVTKEVLSTDLSYLKGKNIFSLDLLKESRNIIRNCPDCSRVRLARILPDRIYVEFIRRKPLALVKLYRYFAVDEDGVIFYNSMQPDASGLFSGQAGLPVILGLETKIFGLKPGIRCETRELVTALLILKEAARNRLLKDYKIQKVDITSIDDITLKIPLTQKPGAYANWKTPNINEFLEIKISQANIRDKIVIMAGLINQEKYNLEDIKYIDLRFKEPVIKFKDVK